MFKLMCKKNKLLIRAYCFHIIYYIFPHKHNKYLLYDFYSRLKLPATALNKNMLDRACKSISQVCETSCVKNLKSILAVRQP